jgi:hypothetical protein
MKHCGAWGSEGRKPPDAPPGTPQRIVRDKRNVRNPQTGEDIPPLFDAFCLTLLDAFAAMDWVCACGIAGNHGGFSACFF